MENYSKIIVTGAGGWLGFGLLSHLDKLINQRESIFFGSKIVALVQDKTSRKMLEKLDIEVCLGDLRDEECIDKLLQDVENAVVFNLAGIIHPTLFRQRDFDDINHHAMVNFATLAAARGVRKFVAMSSNSPCGYSKDVSCVFNEESPYSPYMGYGHSKMSMEKKLLDLARASEVSNFTIVRAPWFYGPFQPERQTEFFSLIKNGVFPLIGEGKGMRSMAYIDNLVQGLILTAEYYTTNGEIFWIADQNPYSMSEIVSTIKTVLERDFDLSVSARQIYLPSVVSDVARVADYASQAMGCYIQKVHVLSEMNQTISCSIQKAQLLLGYFPAVKLEEGMRKSIAWCLENGRQI